MSARPAISACLLCFNDAATISELVAAAARALDQFGDAEIVVVDDGSSDDSVEVLRRAARAEPRLRIVTHPENRGYGAALRTALGAAQGEWAFYTDGDGQYDPAEMSKLVQRSGHDTDWVQGRRSQRADGRLRVLVGVAYRALVRAAFGLRTTDPTCDFRLIRTEVLDQLELERSSGAAVIELVLKLERVGAHRVDVEVGHRSRTTGRSQFFRPRRVLRSLLDLVSLWFALGRRRPAQPGTSATTATESPNGS